MIYFTKDDEISNNATDAKIYAYAGNDSMYNFGARSSVYAGNGNDTIFNYNANDVYIDGGAGNDIILNQADYTSSINSRDGNDFISIKSAGSIRAEKVMIRFMALPFQIILTIINMNWATVRM